MKHGSLFSGIGGFDLAAQWMGWKNIFHCEWNEFGQKVLKYYWPKAISYGDITKTDFTIHRGQIDILTGGFPCQPYSTAGKRKGKEDDRHLWPEMLRAIREIQPSYVVGENVRGLTNWNGGMVFDEVQADLETQGYEVLPFLLPACSINAPHRRDRIWFIAHSSSNGCNWNKEYTDRQQHITRGQTFGESNAHVPFRDASDTNNGIIQKSEWKQGNVEQKSKRQSASRFNYGTPQNWIEWPTKSPICNGDDGLSNRLDGITFPKWRTESIKAGGNAIVPQIAYEIFKAIENM